MPLTVGELNAELGLDTSRFSSGLQGAQGLAHKGALIISAALGAAAVKSLRAFVDFDTGMREIFTLMPGMTDEAMTLMSSQVRDFAEEFGLLTSEVIPALYQAISAGVPQGDLFSFMEVAAKTARGGVTDLETAVNGLTGAVNSYGVEVLSATDAADVMFTGVRLGKTTIGELSANLFQVLPVAAATGVSFDQVVAAMAAMSAQNVPTTVGATNLRGALVELGREGTTASNAFERITGQTFPDFIAAGGTLTEALNLFADDAEASGTAVQNSFAAVEAGMAATVLSSDTGAQLFGDNMDAMAERAGAADEAFGTMAVGVGFSFDQLKAMVEGTLLDLGDALMPSIEALLPAIKAILPSLGDLITPLAEGLVPVVEALAPLLEELAPLFTTVGELVGNLAPLIGVLVDAWKPLLAVVNAVVGAISGVVGFFGAVTGDWMSGADAATERLNESLSDLYGELKSGAISLEEFDQGMEDAGASAEKMDEWLKYVAEHLDADKIAYLEAQDGAARYTDQQAYSAEVLAGIARMAGTTTTEMLALEAAQYDVAYSAEEAAANEKELTGWIDRQAAAARAVWEAEQALLDQRRAALDPVYAMIRAEEALAAAKEVLAGFTTDASRETEEYRQAVLDAIAAQADYDIAAQDMADSTGAATGAIQTLARELGIPIEGIQSLIDLIQRYNDTNVVPKTFAMILQQYGAPGIVGANMGYAEGGVVPRTQAVLVGERGPEIAIMPGGSQIWPNGEVPRGFGGSEPIVVQLHGDVILDGARVGEVVLQGGQRQVLLRTGARS
jgi:TP901 family phage tail tape measure protein